MNPGDVADTRLGTRTKDQRLRELPGLGNDGISHKRRVAVRQVQEESLLASGFVCGFG